VGLKVEREFVTGNELPRIKVVQQTIDGEVSEFRESLAQVMDTTYSGLQEHRIF
jgi:hypothetical protein